MRFLPKLLTKRLKKAFTERPDSNLVTQLRHQHRTPTLPQSVWAAEVTSWNIFCGLIPRRARASTDFTRSGKHFVEEFTDPSRQGTTFLPALKYLDFPRA